MYGMAIGWNGIGTVSADLGVSPEVDQKSRQRS